jgi:hypothetical protein
MNTICEKKDRYYYVNVINVLRNNEALTTEERENLIIEFYSYQLFKMPSYRKAANILNVFSIPTINGRGKWNSSAVKKLHNDIMIQDAREFIRMSKEDWVEKNGLKYRNSLEEARNIAEFRYSPVTKEFRITSNRN